MRQNSPCWAGTNDEIYLQSLKNMADPKWQTEHDRVIREDENSETITKIVQELAGTWRMRDQKLFDIIRNNRKVPIGAMKEQSNE